MPLYSKMRFGVLSVAVLCLTLLGCSSDDGPPKAKVSGAVAIDSQPIADGTIIFFPSDGKGREVAAPIVEGKYEMEVGLGPKTVKILATKKHPTETEPDINGNPVPKVISIVPPKYNDKTELKIEVTGEMTKDFTDLKSE